jgi:hypothetical protein
MRQRVDKDEFRRAIPKIGLFAAGTACGKGVLRGVQPNLLYDVPN